MIYFNRKAFLQQQNIFLTPSPLTKNYLNYLIRELDGIKFASGEEEK